ncbi:MAG: tRNA guanosine(34) transglycosylase Tgt [Candidatus Delongbacteria bacterium]|nr:tRNA guanosine(34) transglycosylase Tgt [Candidatus Delongbacteria bacterium]
MSFQIAGKDKGSDARAGVLKTSHGDIMTPVFMPVGTLGTVKGVDFTFLEQDIKAQIILGNTYHLFLRPGLQVIENAGGLHKFNSWTKPILTDSGGYQVFSLADNRKITDEGVTFKSHIDGSSHLFTPENVVDTQRSIGADIMMALDECTPYPCEYDYAKKSMQLTHRWLERGFKHVQQTAPMYGYDQHYFPIVQGSVYDDLRQQSAEFISAFDAAGYAIGGLSVGEPHDMMYKSIETVNAILPEDKPRYLMGVGTPENLIEAIARGVDMFDCVMPTRNGRNGMLFTIDGIINIKNKKWENDFSALDEKGTSFVDKRYSKAYLRHLIHNNELLGAQIASIHNLAFYLKLMQVARQKIVDNQFTTWKNGVLGKLKERR